MLKASRLFRWTGGSVMIPDSKPTPLTNVRTRPAPLEGELVDGPSRQQLELLARFMDDLFVIPGTGIRFGLDAILGLIPGIGDTATSLVAFYILNAARQHGVPRVTLVRMAGNVAIDFIVGSVPFIGDLFDVTWKANRKNVELLQRHIVATPTEQRKARRGDWLFVAGLILGLILLLIGSITVAVWLVTWIASLLGSGGTTAKT